MTIPDPKYKIGDVVIYKSILNWKEAYIIQRIDTAVFIEEYGWEYRTGEKSKFLEENIIKKLD